MKTFPNLPGLRNGTSSFTARNCARMLKKKKKKKKRKRRRRRKLLLLLGEKRSTFWTGESSQYRVSGNVWSSE